MAFSGPGGRRTGSRARGRGACRRAWFGVGLCVHGDQRKPEVTQGRRQARHVVSWTVNSGSTRYSSALSGISSPARWRTGPGGFRHQSCSTRCWSSHRVSAVPSARGPGLEAACGRRREAADRAGVHLLRAPVRIDAAPGRPGQPLGAVRPAGAAAEAPGRARGDQVDPGLPGRARADHRGPGAHAVGPGARRGAAAQRQAPHGGQDAEQRAGLGADRRLLAGRAICVPLAPPGRARWPRCTPRSTRRGAPRKPGAWRSPWPAGCGT